MKSYLYSHNTYDNPVLMTDKRLARENDEWLTTNIVFWYIIKVLFYKKKQKHGQVLLKPRRVEVFLYMNYYLVFIQGVAFRYKCIFDLKWLRLSIRLKKNWSGSDIEIQYLAVQRSHCYSKILNSHVYLNWIKY